MDTPQLSPQQQLRIEAPLSQQASSPSTPQYISSDGDWDNYQDGDYGPQQGQSFHYRWSGNFAGGRDRHFSTGRNNFHLLSEGDIVCTPQ